MNEAAILSILSGERRGVSATLARGALWLASGIYGPVVRLRNAAYRTGLLPSRAAGVPVISVGNLTTGGTGKTPFVAWLARWAMDHGRNPALVSRGYRSLDESGNDEKRVLERLCPDVPHLQNRDRLTAAKEAVARFRADLLILDDGFQHRRLKRDLDIVLIDALKPWGYGHLLPRGLLREPRSGLRRADVIVITRADQASTGERAIIRDMIARTGAHAPVVEIAYPLVELLAASGESASLGRFSGAKLIACCGIGNPGAFRTALASVGLHPAQFLAFPDHHHYGPADFERLAQAAQETGAAALITTEKDLVKFPATGIQGCDVWAARIGTRILTGADELERRLLAVVNRTPECPR